MAGSPKEHPLAAQRLTARQLVADIGPALLRMAHDGAYSERPLSEVVLYAPGAPEPAGPEAIVLGVGVRTAAELAALSESLHDSGAGVMVVKAPLAQGVHLGRLTVVEVNAEAAWMHVASTIREQLLDYARASVRSDGFNSELFSIANAIYAEFNAPVTIEDRFSALVAWSAGQERSDAERIDTILGRAVQQETLVEQRQRGEFELLHASDVPLFMPALIPDHLARVAIAVRAGTEVLGYIWAAVSEPLSPEQSQRFSEFAPSVALRLANLRTETSYARKQRGELTAAVLSGSASQVEASRLHLGTGPLCVMAAAPRVQFDDDAGGVSDAVLVSDLQRFADTLEYFLTAVHPRSAAVVGTGAVYVLVGWAAGTDDPLAATAQLARDFLSRTPLTQHFMVSVSGPAAGLGEVKQLRAQADASLRALRHPADRGPAVRTVDEAALSVMLLHLSDAIDALGLPVSTGALESLQQHDGPNGLLTATLAAYLDAAGAVDVAARVLHVHPNTMRYRLRRIREISGLDFAHADSLLLAHLQLRVSALRAEAGIPGQPREGR